MTNFKLPLAILLFHIQWSSGWIQSRLANYDDVTTMTSTANMPTSLKGPTRIRPRRLMRQARGGPPIIDRANHHLIVSSAADPFTETVIEFPPWAIVLVAVVLGVATQNFINQMLRGDQGLGSFLRDGSGYNRSAFTSVTKTSRDRQDPLPWLKLPQLDYVDVAGQEGKKSSTDNDAAVPGELERLRLEMNAQIEQGNYSAARAIRDDLEKRMKDYGMEYTADGP